MKWLAPIVVGVVTLFAYANAAPDAAVHDDRFFVQQWDSDDMGRYFERDVWGHTGVSSGLYRPLLLVSLTADSALYGDSPKGYHWTNTALHILATLLLYGLLRALLLGAWPAAEATLAAALAALCFGVHPIHTEAVCSIFNRSEIAGTIGVLSAAWIVWRFEDSRRVMSWVAAGAVYLAALLFRESAVSLPVWAVLVLLLKPGTVRERIRRVAPAAALLVPLGIYLWMRHAALEPPPPSGGNWWERLSVTAVILREGLRMLVWPSPLRISYGPEVLTSPDLAFIVVILLIAGAVVARRHAPLVALGAGLFLLSLLPSTRLIADSQDYSVLAERYLYLPSAAAAIALAAGLAALAARVGRAGAAAAAIVLCLPLLSMTRERNLDWHSDRALFEAEVRVAPEAEALRLLTAAYAEEDDHAAIVRVCDEHLARHPDSPKLNLHCGIGYAGLGRVDEAERAYLRCAASDDYAVPNAHTNLAMLYLRQGRRAEARTAFGLAVDAELNPARKHFRRARMLAFTDSNRLAEVRTELLKALELQPDFAPAKLWLENLPSAPPRQQPAQQPPPQPSVLSADARAALIRALRMRPPGTPVWFASSQVNPGAQSLTTALENAFAEAGWRPQPRLIVPFSIRPGVLVLAADETIGDDAEAAASALEAAGLTTKLAGGYRAYYAEMTRTKPGFTGFPLGPMQGYVIVVGRLETAR